MNKQHLKVSAVAFAVSLALGACGGGSSSTSSSAPGTTRGVITGFGSVFVNGVEYDVDTSANVTMDGATGSESALQVGMVVTLDGAVNADGKTGLATSIKYSDLMEGVVIANSVAANGTGTMNVMGQTVNVVAETVFESGIAGITSADLVVPGNVVEVSGYASSTGDVFATRIEVKAAAQTGEIEMKGIVANLTATTFTLGTLTVDYSGVASGDMPSTLADGNYVEVKSTTTFNGIGNLIASKIELEDDGFTGHDGVEGEELKVEGIVTVAFDSVMSTFELNGRSVLVDSSTEFDGGSADLLTLGAKIKVETHVDANGSLVANSIEFGHDGDLEFGGTVEAADAVAGTLTVMGKTIYVDKNNTMMVDESSAAVRYFDLADISATSSDHVEIHAYLDSATGHLMATKVKREDPSNEASLKGSVSTAGGLTVEGINVDISGVITPPSLVDGNMVEISGTYSSGVLNAIEISVQ